MVFPIIAHKEDFLRHQSANVLKRRKLEPATGNVTLKTPKAYPGLKKRVMSIKQILKIQDHILVQTSEELLHQEKSKENEER